MQCASGRRGEAGGAARGAGEATGPHCVGMQGMRTWLGLAPRGILCGQFSVLLFVQLIFVGTSRVLFEKCFVELFYLSVRQR